MRVTFFTDGPGGMRLFRSSLYRGFWIVLGRISILIAKAEGRVS